MPEETEQRFAVGLDLGGTAIKGIAVDRRGRVLGEEETGTHARAGAEAVSSRLVDIARRLITAGGGPGRLAGVGVGVPGVLDPARQTVLVAPNLAWRNFPLAARLVPSLQAPVFLDNDANLAALGESCYGAGQGKDPLLMVTVGTGIGSGLIIGGQVHRGRGGSGAELGHVAMSDDGPPCACGRRGCLETFASATAVVRAARQALAEGQAGLLASLTTLEARDVFAAAGKGDVLAAAIVEKAVHYLGTALANAALLVQPAAIVVGGGVARAGDVLFRPLTRRVAEIIGPLGATVAVSQAALGNQAGAMGAARMALENMGDGHERQG